MLFDITNYNQNVLLVTFLIFVIFLFMYFNAKMASILDPMAMHIFWIAGNMAFLFGFVYKYGFSTLPALFLIFYILYAWLLRVILPNAKNNNVSDRVYELLLQKEGKIKIVYVIITVLYFISKKPFFVYALENPSIPSWFLYRFVDLQGRDPLLRILETGSGVYFYFLSFILVFLIKVWKKRVWLFIIISLIISVFAGGRSSVLGGLVFLGAFIFYFNRSFNKSFIRKLNFFGFILVFISLFLAIVVTSFYEKDATIMDGFYVIVNRFIAVGDGLEYYMLYNGPKHIQSGISNYIMAVFGVYIKQFTGIDYKNVGTQLTELVVGEVSFAQGANFDFPLQTMVMGFYAWIIYIPFIAFIVAKFRANKSNSVIFLPLSFFLSYHCFTLATDMEYGILCLISGFLVYFIFIYPILKIRLR